MAFSIVNDGKRRWSMERDKDGYRTYRLRVLVRSTNSGDGPALALQTPGLPLPGQVWNFDNDYDPWCYCQMPVGINPLEEHGPNHEFELEFTFSNKPDERRCKQNQIDDPLLMPPEISGGFTRFQEEAQLDRWGQPILTSSHELIRGPHNEWDRNRPTIRITQNVPVLNLGVLAQMVDTVNAFPLWELPPRTIKLTSASWQRKYYGQCYVYYSRTLEFEVSHRKVDSIAAGDSLRTGTAPVLEDRIVSRYENWDRYLLDEGTKALNGGWDSSGRWKLKKIAGQLPSPTNPAHFCAFRGRDGNLMKCVLDGSGMPFEPSANDVLRTCNAACPDSVVPKYWRLLDAEPAYITLENSGGCGWAGTSAATDKTYSLEFSEALRFWKLLCSDGRRWDVAEKNFQCLGANLLTNPFDTAIFPNSVRLQWGAQPGMIGVSVYGESDFLLLGIPLTF